MNLTDYSIEELEKALYNKRNSVEENTVYFIRKLGSFEKPIVYRKGDAFIQEAMDLLEMNVVYEHWKVQTHAEPCPTWYRACKVDTIKRGNEIKGPNGTVPHIHVNYLDWYWLDYETETKTPRPVIDELLKGE